MRYTIRYWCVSHIGKIRETNQDNFICDGAFFKDTAANKELYLRGAKDAQKRPVFGIFDGMGGEAFGEVASCIAAKNAATLQLSKDPLSDLDTFCRKANADICAFAEAQQVSAMGTTAAMLVFSKKDVTLCNIGDSKIFFLSAGQLQQISKDHVAPAVCGKKPPLSQSLGIPPEEMTIVPYYAKGTFRKGDKFLICSDGLTDMVTPEEIKQILTENDSQTACLQLLNKALEAGGRDNTTFILCDIEKKSIFQKNRKRTQRPL